MKQLSIFTIGHGTRKIIDFVNLLKTYGITTLIDVRTNPFSRFHPSYNKAALATILEREGINYLHKGDALGGKPKADIFYTNGKVNYKLIALHEVYKNAINELVEAISKDNGLCLMCSESKPDLCHRKMLIGNTLSSLEINIIHIDNNGEVVNHLTENQLPTLF